mmetsp:Transcript_16301/g.32820  ORF Transcript_16301/g.32820 Transcript_16301/m.32820 type:complete len:141 (+) Transcript_16301:103-525(+)
MVSRRFVDSECFSFCTLRSASSVSEPTEILSLTTAPLSPFCCIVTASKAWSLKRLLFEAPSNTQLSGLNPLRTLQITSSIQSISSAIREYTPGYFDLAHPNPQETIPTWVTNFGIIDSDDDDDGGSIANKGWPESPEQAS